MLLTSSYDRVAGEFRVGGDRKGYKVVVDTSVLRLLWYASKAGRTSMVEKYRERAFR